jgi:hypothetical protein
MVMTVKVIPFGTKDNGGDLVETSFLCQGLLTVRYFKNGTTTEQAIATKADAFGKAWNGILYTKEKMLLYGIGHYLWLGNEF